MNRKFEEMHPMVQDFVNQALRPTMLALADNPEFRCEDLEDLRQMLIGAAKGTVDLELEKSNRSVGGRVVLARPGLKIT